MDAAKQAPDAAATTGSVAAIVVGAGQGQRMGGVDKAFLPLLGRPLLAYAVDALEACPQVNKIALVVSAALVERCRHVARAAGWQKVSAICAGGAVRAASVQAGLAAVKGAEWVLIHDAARPLLTPALVASGLAAAAGAVAAIAAVPVRDTIKRARPDRTVVHTVDRSQLWAAQTPQIFRRATLAAAFRQAGAAADDYTDEGALLESQGIAVRLFPGDPANIKVTVPADVEVAAALLTRRDRAPDHRPLTTGHRPLTTDDGPLATRVGTGYDIHRLVPGRRLVLGGVALEHPDGKGLAGHSDADVLTHAIMDALLGAAGLPDIGQLFPNTDPAYRGASSLELLRTVANKVRTQGWRIRNLDATVVAEAPRLAAHLPAMCQALAAALTLCPAQINVKATSNEGLDAVGRGQAIAAQAVALLTRLNAAPPAGVERAVTGRQAE